MLQLQLVPPEIENIILKLQLPVFSKKDTCLTYRALNHYQKIGVVVENRENAKEWHKFNGVDIIWINIVDQLRVFGVRLEDIANLRIKIFIDGKFGSIDKANYISRDFIQEIALSIFKNYKLYFVVFSDFSYAFHDSQTIDQWINKSYKDEPHISIPIYNSIRDTWKNIKSVK